MTVSNKKSIVQISSPESKQYDVRNFHALSIDAEWCSTYKPGRQISSRRTIPNHSITHPLSLQLCFDSLEGNKKLFYFLDASLPLPQLRTIEGHDVTIIQISEWNGVLQYFYLPEHLSVKMFFSPKDPEILLGIENWKKIVFEDTTIYQQAGRCKTNNKGLSVESACGTTKIVLDDLVKLSSGGLDSLLLESGFNNQYKNLVEESGFDKSEMKPFFSQYPDGAFLYAMGDVIYLYDSLVNKVKTTNIILQDILRIPHKMSVDSLKRTQCGSVSDLFYHWLEHHHQAIYLTSMMQSTSTDDKTIMDLYDKIQCVRQSDKADTTEFDQLKKLVRNKKVIPGIGAASVKAFDPNNYPGQTSALNALLTGGRCINEQPTKNTATNVFDIDITGAYGTTLLQLQYPFGLPTIYTRRGAGRRCTLKTFLQKYKDELVDGLWTITVDGDLDFLQDLLVSKYDVDNNKTARSIMASFEDDFTLDKTHKQLPGQSVLTTSQISNAIITSDILEIIEKVTTSKELASIMRLTVSTAIYYPKSKQLSNEDWVNEIWETPGDFVVKDDQRINDERSRYWTTIPIKDFIGVFIDKRKEAKQKSSHKGDQFDILQQSLKLMINNFYGSIAAKDYAHNNVVVANNITSKTRVGVWMMAKALRLRQTITDGGMYCIDDVNYLKTDNKTFRRPGLHILYNRDNELQKHLKQRPLFNPSIISDIKLALDKNDHTTITTLQQQIDYTALDHITTFWNTYKVPFRYNIEHKITNTAFRASYSGKADYALELVSPASGDQSKIYNGVLFKLRGENKLKTSGKMKHMYKLLYPDCGITDEEIEVSFKSMLVSIKEAQRLNDTTHEMIFPGAEVITQQVYSITPLSEQILPRDEKEHKKQERNLNNRKKAILDRNKSTRFSLPESLKT